MFTSKEKGDQGENAAINYLIQKGYIILERNFRTRYGEIDIIARDGEYITFVEVKSRKDFLMGLPCEAVNISKQRKIARMALFYITKSRLYYENFRFDIVELVLNNNEINYLRLIKDAFQTDLSY